MPGFGVFFSSRGCPQRGLLASICPLWYVRHAMVFDNVEEVDMDDLDEIVGEVQLCLVHEAVAVVLGK